MVGCIGLCKKIKKFDNETLEQVEAFLNQPVEWSKNNGGK